MLALLFFPVSARPVTNPLSKFSQAREPASELDLTLFNVAQQWRYSILKHSDYFAATAPLVVKARIFIHCSYNPLTDKISVTGFISNEEDFFHFTLFDRKELLKQTLYLLLDFLKPRINYVNSKKHLDINDLKLELVLNSSPPIARGILKDYDLPNGQAGFINGRFIFSEEYYLTIRSKKIWEGDRPMKNTIIMIPFDGRQETSPADTSSPGDAR